MPHTALNLAQAADALNLSPTELEQLVSNGEIPFERQAGRLVFRRGQIERWASMHILSMKNERLATYHQESAGRVEENTATDALIPVLLRPSSIEAALASRTKPSVLRDMVDLAESTGYVNYPLDLLRAIREREEAASTAMEGGVALLHAAQHDPYLFSQSFLVLGRAIHPVPFHAPDGRRTGLFFLLCCDEPRLHLHAMARLCLLCSEKGMLEALRTADGAEHLYRLLADAEQDMLRRIQTAR